MPDREKVIKVLECHVNGHPHTRCHKCPYWGTGPHCSSECSVLAADALALLKAQEPEVVDAPKPDSDIGCWYDITHNYTLEQVVSALKAQEPIIVQKKQIEMVGLKTWDWACGNCGQTVLFSAKFCPWCGRAVKWE